MTNVISELKMLDFYFSKYSCSFLKKTNLDNLKMSFVVNMYEHENDHRQVKIVIDTRISAPDNGFVLDLQTIGSFKIETQSNDEQLISEILRKNTVAIMFPFIRSEVSLLTTQPGMKPVMLPLIDVNALVDSDNKE